MSRRNLPWLAVVVFLTAGAAAVMMPHRSPAAPQLDGSLLPERLAPGFHLRDQYGHGISLAQFHGRPVVLTFLEARCRRLCPIVAEQLRQTVTRLGPAGRRVAIVAVSTDPEGDSKAAVRQFSRRHGMLRRWHYLTGSRTQLRRVWRAYYIYAAPRSASPLLKQSHTSATYLIDRDGRERVLFTGNPDGATLSRDLLILLGLPPAPAARGAPAPQAGRPAPGLTLSSIDGTRVALRSYRGRVVLLNFWATWCPPCRTEMPRLTGWYRRLRPRGFVVLGIDQQESRGDVAAFVRKLHIPYPILLDDSGAASARYDVVGLPTSFLIDRQGVIRNVRVGAVDAGYRVSQLAPLVASND